MNVLSFVTADEVKVLGPTTVLIKIPLAGHPELSITALVARALNEHVRETPNLRECQFYYTKTHLEILAFGTLDSAAVAKYT